MADTYQTLCNKFITEDDQDNGISKASHVLITAGFRIENGWIKQFEAHEINLDTYTRGEIMDAIDFLLEHHDYGWEEDKLHE